MEACPLCGSREAAAGLPQAIEDKLKSLASLRNALTNKERAQRAVDQSAALLESVWSLAGATLRQLRAACTTSWRADFPALPDVLATSSHLSGDLEQDRAHLLKRLAAAASRFALELEPEVSRRAQ